MRNIKPIPETRVCKKCNIEKPITSFQKQNHRKNWFTHDCKDCRNKTAKEKYKTDGKLIHSPKPRQIKEKKSYDKTIPYFEIKDGKLILRYNGEKKIMTINLNISPDHADYLIRVREIAIGKPIFEGVHPSELKQIV